MVGVFSYYKSAPGIILKSSGVYYMVDKGSTGHCGGPRPTPGSHKSSGVYYMIVLGDDGGPVDAPDLHQNHNRQVVDLELLAPMRPTSKQKKFCQPFRKRRDVAKPKGE